MTKSPNDHTKSKRKLSRQGADQQSFVSNDSSYAGGSAGEDVIDLVLEEKRTIAMNPEKMAGAFRVSADVENTRDMIPSDGSDSSDDGSESCIIVIPRASLVQDKDLEKGTNMDDIPILVAEERLDSVENVAAQPRSGKSRVFRVSVLLCLLLIASLLGVLLYVLLGDQSPSNQNLPPSNNTNNNYKPPPPPPLPSGDGGNDFSNGDGESNFGGNNEGSGGGDKGN